MPIPFYEPKYLKFKDLERCPYSLRTEYRQNCEWMIADNKRMLLIALDRYADVLQKISMDKNQYKCAVCGEIFNFVRDETWSEEKANEEYKQKFPGASFENRDIICDDCWQFVKPDRTIKPNIG